MDIQTFDDIVYYILLWIIFLISIWFHEYAHAYVSSILWDPTPKLQWRLTVNPFAHIDIVWFLMIFVIHFGWWKPVQVNPHYYKNPLKDELLVALAWPFSNFIMAFLWIFIWAFLLHFWQSNHLIDLFFNLFVYINIALAIFNLIPIYPLDGYRIVKFVKPSWGTFMEQNAFVFYLFFLFLVFLPWNPIWRFILMIVDPIFNFLMYIVSFIL